MTPPTLLTRSRAFCVSLVAFLGCFGPLPPRDELPPPGSLRGPLVFRAGPGAAPGRCSPAESDAIRRAWEVARRLVTTQEGRLRACLGAARFSPADDAWAELILAKLREDSVTYVDCTDMAAKGEAPIASRTGVIRLSHEALQSRWRLDPNVIAGAMLHELAHNRGYVHHGERGTREYEASVNYQLERCAARLTQVGTVDPAQSPATDEATSDAWLQPLGATGATDAEPFALDCGPRERMIGQRVRVDPVSGRAMAVGIRCAGDVGGVIEPRSPSASSGVADDCASGEVVVGVRAFATPARVTGVQFLCRALARSWAAPTALPLRGSDRGALVAQRVCPAGQAVVALTGTLDEGLGRLGVECRDPVRPAYGAHTELQSLGARGGADPTRLFARCGGRGVLVGLFGHRASDGTVVRLGGVCQETAVVDGAVRVREVTATTPDFITPGSGGVEREDVDAAFGHDRDDPLRRGLCPVEYGMVGVNVALSADGARIQGLQVLCARPESWLGAAPQEPSRVEVVGSFTERDVRVGRCSQGQFLVGLGVHTARGVSGDRALVTGVTPICRDFLVASGQP